MNYFTKILISAIPMIMLFIAPAYAAEAAVTLDAQKISDSKYALVLRHDSEECFGVQASFTFAEDPDKATMQFPDALSQPGVHCAYTSDADTLTVYITSKTALDAVLPIGTVTAAKDFSAPHLQSVKLVGIGGMSELANKTYPDTGKNPNGGNTGSGTGNSGSTNSGTGDSGSSGNISGGTSNDSGGDHQPGDTPAALPFCDVANGAWYWDAVASAYQNGLMRGTDATHFSPDKTMSRAEMVTVLYRLSGAKAGQYTAHFPDVEKGAWYADAANWANKAGIITGYSDGRFGGADSMTREQMAVVLYRYASRVKIADPVRGDLGKFTDGQNVSDFAKDAMRWAVGKKLISGTDAGRLLPASGMTRAEAAVILSRYSALD